MTNREAINLLIQATGLLQMNRADHKRVEDALTVLAVLVDKDERASEKNPE